jgi:MEDS: MEthanogen/methylotroph, DcmR Sensory domain
MIPYNGRLRPDHRARPEGVRQKPVASDHTLQLFDTDKSLGRNVAAFLAAGVPLEQTLLVVCTPAHWDAIAGALRATPLEPERAISEGRLMVLDAEEQLSRFMRRGEPVRALFEQSVGDLIDRLTARAVDGLRIYGEMVELLARDGNYPAAARLEELWNELGTRYPFTLLCGYSSAHFAAPDAGSALTAIRCQHSRTVSLPSDPLGRYLLTARRPRSVADVG